MTRLRGWVLVWTALAISSSLCMGATLEAQYEDRPCTRTTYPDFLALPPSPAIEHPPVPDPSGIGKRWSSLIQTALRPNPKDFSWYRECGTWVCRYQQTDQVIWQSFPPETNAAHLAGILVKGRLLIASVADLIKQGLAPGDLRPFEMADLAVAERTRHPLPPAD